MDNIILIGMPASGKSTAGVLLAKTLGYEYIDCDLVIQQLEGALLSEIIEKRGREEFILTEERILSEIEAEKCVIATGGSAVYGERAMAHLKKSGTTVYLRVSVAELTKRLGGKDILRRGVVMRGQVKTLAGLYAQRAPLYEKYADITVDCDGLSLEQTVDAVVRALGSFNSRP